MADPLEELGAPPAEADPLAELGAPPADVSLLDKGLAAVKSADELLAAPAQVMASEISKAAGQAVGALGAGAAEIGKGLYGVAAKGADLLNHPDVADKLIELGAALKPEDIFHKIEGKMTWEPPTEAAKGLQKLVEAPATLLSKAGDVAGGKAIEAGLPASVATVIDLGIKFGPQLALGKLVPSIKGIDAPIKDVVDLIGTKTSDFRIEALDPIGANGPSAAAIASDFASKNRAAQYSRNATIKELNDEFSPEQHKAMYEALSEENVKRRTGAVDETKGFARLPEAERSKLEKLSADHEATASRAVELGILGDKFDIYDPRVAVQFLDDGTIKALGGKATTLGGMGKNLQRTVKQAGIERKHLTAEETEAALQRMGDETGKNLGLLRDVRMLPIVTASLKRAIAGRELLSAIKAEGDKVGAKTVSTKPEGEGWFTVEGSPLFTLRRPVIRAGAAVKDANERTVFQTDQLCLAPEYKGPMTAIMDGGEPGKIYKGLMEIKRIGIGNIMFNPLTHNITILSKVVPFGLHRTPGWYAKGYALRQNPEFMKEAMTNGGVMFVDQARLSSEIEGGLPSAQLSPGRSLTAKALGAVGDTAGVGDQLRRGVDKFGDFWHGTLLWNRIADMQAGLYSWVKEDLGKKGVPDKAASAAAGRLANLYGGAIPREELADLANKTANVALFSKSFTGTNLALYKDALAGFPASTRGKILRAYEEAGKTMEQADAVGKTYARRQAAAAIVKDIALAYGGVAAAHFAIQKMKQSDDKIAQDYGRRLNWVMNQSKADPAYPFQNPIDTTQYLLAPVEHGKEGRVYIGDDAVTNRPLYARPTFGKVADDLIQAWKSPGELLKRKLSPFAKFSLEVAKNEDFRGAKLWLADEGFAKNMYDITKEFVKLNFPSDVLSSANELLNDNQLTDAQRLRLFGAFTGAFSVSQGIGQEKALMLEQQGFRADRLKREMPEINRLIDTDPQKAVEQMQELGLRPGQIMDHLRRRAKISQPSLRSRFNAGRTMDDEVMDLMERPTNE